MMGLIRLLFVAGCLSSSVSSAVGQVLDQLYDNVKAAPHLELINSAKSTIDIEIYSMKNTKILNALKSAVKRGVKVRIVQEPRPVSERCLIFTPIIAGDDAKCVEQKSFVAYVRKNKGKYVPFDKKLCGIPDSNCFQHGKVIIVDKQLVLMSTGNFNSSSFCDEAESPTVCNRDYSIVSRDRDVVKTIQKVFDADVAGRKLDVSAVLRTPEARRVTISPLSLDPIVGFIDSARKTIQLQNQYLKNPEYNAALVRAAKRGVKVFIMVASACAFGRPKPHQVEQWNQTYGEFDAAGIHTKTFNASIPIGGRPGYLHSKAILVDSERAWVGSVNGSTTSLTLNREYGLFSNEAQVVRELGTILYTDYVQKGTQSWRDSLRCKRDYIKPEIPDDGDDTEEGQDKD
ncbi:MAG: phosphatidylserine/phosphatidylglycerophosphate/cardiolipin synthase family protein [Bdellovibrionales bacterium]|nr:phosphatidylserine/phosphatidylglycerophosphate/cardiolipin synthase family protein [Bdellovibrionales bacterium]